MPKYTVVRGSETTKMVVVEAETPEEAVHRGTLRFDADGEDVQTSRVFLGTQAYLGDYIQEEGVIKDELLYEAT